MYFFKSIHNNILISSNRADRIVEGNTCACEAISASEPGDHDSAVQCTTNLTSTVLELHSRYYWGLELELHNYSFVLTISVGMAKF